MLGRLEDLPADAPFDDAHAALARLVHDHYGMDLPADVWTTVHEEQEAWSVEFE